MMLDGSWLMRDTRSEVRHAFVVAHSHRILPHSPRAVDLRVDTTLKREASRSDASARGGAAEIGALGVHGNER